MMTDIAGANDMLMIDDLKFSGRRIDLPRFFALVDKASGTFAIATR